MSNLAENIEYSGFEKPRQFEILILDDSEFDRKRMRRAWTRLPVGLHVTEVENLDAFGDEVLTKKFDVILVDYALTDGDGLQALQKIKVSEINREATVVMVTGNDSSALAVNAMKLGFDDYLTKDELNSDSLSGFLPKSMISGVRNGAPIPLAVPQSTLEKNVNTPEGLSQVSFENALEPALKSALDNAVIRARMENLGDNVVSLLSSLQDEDEFIFINLH